MSVMRADIQEPHVNTAFLSLFGISIEKLPILQLF